MKTLLGKATEQILVGIGVSLQDVSSYKQDPAENTIPTP